MINGRVFGGEVRGSRLGKAEGYGKAEESVPDLEEEKNFCKVKFVYMKETSGNRKKIRTPRDSLPT